MANANNLGYPVTTRTYSWEAMVIPEWGEQWNQRVVQYRMSNGRTFVDNNNTQQGIYQNITGYKILLEPLKQPQFVGQVQDALAQDPTGSGLITQG